MRTSLKVYSDKLLARLITELNEEDSITSLDLITSSSTSSEVLDLPSTDNPF